MKRIIQSSHILRFDEITYPLYAYKFSIYTVIRVK